MRKIVAGILSVGSGIGQSVVDSCLRSNLNLFTVGLSNSHLSYGGFLCDKFDIIPGVKEAKYLDVLIEKCYEYSINVLIPGLDFEVLVLSRNKKIFEDKGIKIIVADHSFVSVVRAKKDYASVFSNFCCHFVKSFSTTELQNEEIQFPVICKPNEGSGSNGVSIIFNKTEINRDNDNYFYQEIAFPESLDENFELYCQSIDKGVICQISEISAQIVVGKNGNVLGRMCTKNELKNGVPIKMIPYDDKKVWKVIDELLPSFISLGYSGPLNIQGRLTDEGFKIFEINARFTGITGWRSMVGFNEVEHCILDVLNLPNNKILPLEFSYNKCGVRQVENMALFIKKTKKLEAILVTGGNGYLGNLLVKELLDFGHKVYVYDFNANNLVESDRLVFLNANETSVNEIPFQLIDAIIHCAFARPFKSNEQIAQSIRLSKELIKNTVLRQVPVFVNISSKSVYRTDRIVSVKEQEQVSPESIYAEAKYAVEQMLELASSIRPTFKYTSLRLGFLFGPSKGIVPIDFISRITSNIYSGKPIKIVNGGNRFNGLDVRDATEGIIRLLSTSSSEWNKIYNFGAPNSYSYEEVIRRITEITDSSIEPEVDVNLNPGYKTQEIDSKSFYDLLSWKPKHKLEQSLIRHIEMIK
ncbi:UDP-glucose 4-epimerase [Candidatus Izimaplasma bacterium HR1]|jgi:nucleoside-diphosphate-sugar epimerase/carbamoylphosphate synthase large subunit|uniref:NAD-dependent epimerase/dehydratase family protein n=1 Tax=Candidatus Izimoplasma sp. HR1 TaxID=1541959 RepID=UPI0004F8024A|nr:UDP-glucose 4-epimerase [Candidatus Izimaplasma bacterium HR1]